MKELSISGHNHSAVDITSGILPVERGGTGTTSISNLKDILNNSEVIYSNTVYIGGTISTTNTVNLSVDLSSLDIMRYPVLNITYTIKFTTVTSTGDYVNIGLDCKTDKSYEKMSFTCEPDILRYKSFIISDIYIAKRLTYESDTKYGVYSLINPPSTTSIQLYSYNTLEIELGRSTASAYETTLGSTSTLNVTIRPLS